MLKSLTVKNYLNESLTLELDRPESSGFIIESITGIGAEKADINITEIATRDGGLFNSARKGARNIVINLKFQEIKDFPSIEEVRHRSYKYFPIKRKVNLTFLTDTREVEIEGYVESNEPDIFSKDEGCQISILCPFPWFSASRPQYSFSSGHQAMFEFPFKNEIVPYVSVNDSTLYDETIPDWSYTVSGKVYNIRYSEGIIFGEIEKYKFPCELFYDGSIDTGFVMQIKLNDNLVENPYEENENGAGYIVVRNPRYPDKKISVNLNKIQMFLPKCNDIFAEPDEDGWYLLRRIEEFHALSPGYGFAIYLSNLEFFPNNENISAFDKIKISLEAYTTFSTNRLEVGFESRYNEEDIPMLDVTVEAERKEYYFEISSNDLLDYRSNDYGFYVRNTNRSGDGYATIYVHDFKIYGKGEPIGRSISRIATYDLSSSDTVPIAQKGDVIKIRTDERNKGVWYSKPGYTYNSQGDETTSMYWGKYENGKLRSYKDEEFNILSAINKDAEWFQLGPGYNVLEIYHTFHPNSEELLEEDVDLVHADYLEVVVQNDVLYEGV